MTNIVGLTTARKTTRMELLAGWLDGGKLELYDGTRPVTNGGAIVAQLLLVTFDIPDPAGTVTDGVFTGAAIDSALVTQAGTHTATWCRFYDDADAIIGDGDVSTSGAVVNLDDVSLTNGALVSVTSVTIS